MHPWHVKIYQSKLSDWALRTPLSGVLPCGFLLSCAVKYDAFSISGCEDGRVQHILTLNTGVIPDTFEQALHRLKFCIPYDQAKDVHQRLMRWLIEEDQHGRWMFSLLKSDVFIESLDNQRICLDPKLLPRDLYRDLLALYHQNLPSFGDNPFAPFGEIECHLPASSHARLDLLS